MGHCYPEKEGTDATKEGYPNRDLQLQKKRSRREGGTERKFGETLISESSIDFRQVFTKGFAG